MHAAVDASADTARGWVHALVQRVGVRRRQRVGHATAAQPRVWAALLALCTGHQRCTHPMCSTRWPRTLARAWQVLLGCWQTCRCNGHV
jgi:hypothetical protein